MARLRSFLEWALRNIECPASISFRLCRENDCSSQATAADRPITAQPFAAGCALLGALQSTQPFVLCVVIDCASRTDKIK